MHGQFTGIPIVVQTVNAISNTSMMRNLLETALGCIKALGCPALPRQNLVNTQKPAGLARPLRLAHMAHSID